MLQTPGRLPTFVTPSGNGGYRSQTPGQLLSFSDLWFLGI